MAQDAPWQVREFVPDDEQLEYADKAVVKKPFTKVRYYGWVALTDEAMHFRGRTIRKEWVLPPTPTRWKEIRIPYDRFKEIARADRSRAEIRAKGRGRFYLWLRGRDDEKAAHTHRRQARLIHRLRGKAEQADHGDKDAQYPFFRKVEMPPHPGMNPRQVIEALERGNWKAERHDELWKDQD